MVDRERMLDLLAEWEELRQQGKAPDPAQLCPDDPTMQVALATQLRKRQRIHAAIEPDTQVTAVSLPEVPGHEMQEVLGHGGMGIVYRARQKALGRVVAVKMMLGALGPDESKRFRAEAKALATLQHPHVVQVFEAGEADGRLYLVMEHVPGGSLAQQLLGVPLHWRRAAELVAVLASAVQHAHERGVVHRDLKPANVLLADDGTPKIADFGLAKLLGADSGQTRTGAVVGTPSYMAPEQAEGKEVGTAADVYALGAILYECLTGRPPFQSDSAIQTLQQVCGQDPVPPARLNPNVPADLETVCLKCLEKEPANRYASASELADDLRRVLAGESTLARPPSQLELIVRSVRKVRFDPGFRAWVPVTLLLAPIPAVVAAVATALFAGRPDAPQLMLTIMATAITVTQIALFLGNRKALEALPEYDRQQFKSLHGGLTVAAFVVIGIVWLTAPPDRPDHLLLAFPLWMALNGLTYAAHATDAGVMYVLSAFAFAAALLAAWLLPWSPLINGVFISLNLVLISGFLWLTGREEKPPPPASPRP
jgi:predicted Ser/Thr protein kinase